MLEITPLIILCFTNSITPGPNNLILAQIGGNFGFKAGLPYSWGGLSGRIFLQIIIALTIGVAGELLNGLSRFIKVIGTMYLLYMSLYMMFGNKNSDRKIAKIPNFKHGFIGQFVNPKAVMNVFTVLGLFFVDSDNKIFNLLAIILTSGILSFTSGLCWIIFGLKIKSILKSKRSRFIFDIVMFALNILCIFMIWN